MSRPRTHIVLASALVVAALALSGASGDVRASSPAGTAFTYQGQLTETGSPVTASCDFSFGLWDDPAAGSQVGSTVSQTLSVTDGLFITLLDFGSSAFDGDGRYLEIAVGCPTGSGLTTLTPRQQLTPTPYALRSGSTPWTGITGMPAGFADGVDDDHTYTAGAGLQLVGDQFSVVTSTIQTRITGTCTAGTWITAVSDTGAVTCSGVTLDQVGNPAADKTFNLANKTIHWLFTNPSGGMHWEFSGAADGHLLEILTTGGNQNPGTHLLHIESDDSDALPLHVKTLAGAEALRVDGRANITGNTVITGALTTSGAITTSSTISASNYPPSTCAAGSAMRVISASGAVTCETVITGTATANQIALWLTTTQLTGDSAFTYASGTMTVSQSAAANAAILAISANDANAYAPLVIRRTRADSTAPAAGMGANINWQLEGYTDGSAIATGRIGSVWENTQTNDTTDRDAAIQIYTMADNSLAERVRISSGGNVGIGATSPLGRFDVRGASGGGALLYAEDLAFTGGAHNIITGGVTVAYITVSCYSSGGGTGSPAAGAAVVPGDFTIDCDSGAGTVQLQFHIGAGNLTVDNAAASGTIYYAAWIVWR